MITAHNSTTALVAPCPSWCTEPTGHPFDTVGGSDSVSVFRYHHRPIGEVGRTSVALMSEEELVDGVSVGSGAYVDIDHSAGAVVTADEAEWLAEVLRQAVLQLRAIEGS